MRRLLLIRRSLLHQTLLLRLLFNRLEILPGQIRLLQWLQLRHSQLRLRPGNRQVRKAQYQVLHQAPANLPQLPREASSSSIISPIKRRAGLTQCSIPLLLRSFRLYGGSVRMPKTQSWSGSQANNAETQQRAEKNFDKAAKAIEGLIAKTSNAGERSAMQSFLGSLARSTNATYSTNVGQTYTQQASDTQQRTDGSGASVQVNDNARYGAEALRMAEVMLHELYRRQLIPELKMRLLPMLAGRLPPNTILESVPLSAWMASPIDPPKAVSTQRQEGEAAVTTQRPKDAATARAAGAGVYPGSQFASFANGRSGYNRNA